MPSYHAIARQAATATRTAQKNLVLNEASAAAYPFLAVGDIDTAVRVLGEYAPKIDRILEQERLYSAGGMEA